MATHPDRFDIYTAIHKFLRSRLFETATRLGSADFDSRTGSAEAVAFLRQTLADLTKHAAQEEARIHPVLRVRAPEVARALDTMHGSLEAASITLEDLVAELESASGSTRLQLGRKLCVAFNVFLAAHVNHMAVEERESNAALWACLSDPEIANLLRRIIENTPPEDTRRNFEGMLLVVNPQEREELERRANLSVSAA